LKSRSTQDERGCNENVISQKDEKVLISCRWSYRIMPWDDVLRLIL
jgi:hypothetical protein